MTSKAERNARAGRLYYNALTDAAGYPNGMAYWGELSPSEKYFYTMTGLSFLAYMQAEGFVSLQQDVGVNDVYGQGDCADLLRHFEETHAGDKEALDRRINAVRSLSPANPLPAAPHAEAE